MTMPKKGSRRVLVDGTAYRFTVKSEGRNQETLRVVVEPERHLGRVLVATFGRHLLDPIGQPQVKALVQYAISKGWAPAVMTAFVLGNRDIVEMAKVKKPSGSGSGDRA